MATADNSPQKLDESAVVSSAEALSNREQVSVPLQQEDAKPASSVPQETAQVEQKEGAETGIVDPPQAQAQASAVSNQESFSAKLAQEQTPELTDSIEDIKKKLEQDKAVVQDHRKSSVGEETKKSDSKLGKSNLEMKRQSQDEYRGRSQQRRDNEYGENNTQDDDISASLTIESQIENAKNNRKRKKGRLDDDDDKFVTYKVHQLDWFDVESRIKMICNDMMKPIAEIATESKSILEKEQARLDNCLKDTNKLNNAVFYKVRRNKNIFHVMHDEITELKANEIRHEKTIQAQIEAFQRSFEDMSLVMSNHTKAVEGFQEQLDTTRQTVEQNKDSLHELFREMQQKLTQSHTELNGMFKEQVMRQNKIDSSFEKVDEKMVHLDSINVMLEERTKGHIKSIEALNILTQNLKESKQDKSNFQEQRMQIQSDFDSVHDDLDNHLNKIKTMEHFIDKYIPIRVQQLISETIQAIASHTQAQRMQNFEMEKFKRLNEDLLKDETKPELIDLMGRIGDELEETVQKFKKIAKAKQLKLEKEMAQKEALEQGKANNNNNIKTAENIKNINQDASSLESILNSGSKQLLHSKESGESGDDDDYGGVSDDHSKKQISEKPLGGLNMQLVEMTYTTAKASQESSHRPRSRSEIEQAEAQEQEKIEKMEQREKRIADGAHPDDLSSESDQDPAQIALNKQALLEWLTVADFTQEMSLNKFAMHKFRLDEEEKNAKISIQGVLKICKIMIYKIGLTYKRMDILFDELRKEFKQNAQKYMGGLRKDLDLVHEGIQQVHDEMESSVAEQKKIQKQTEKDVKLLIKSNEQMHQEFTYWKQDIHSLAMVQSCQAEYLTMQTIMDQTSHKHRAHFQKTLDSHTRQLKRFDLPNVPASLQQDMQLMEQHQTGDNQATNDQTMNAKLNIEPQQPLTIQKPSDLIVDSHHTNSTKILLGGGMKSNKRNMSPTTQTAELMQQISTLKQQQSQSKQTTPKRSSTAEKYITKSDGTSSYLPIVAKVSTGTAYSFKEHRFDENCQCDKDNNFNESLSYRGMQFKTQEFIEMRAIIHQKLEQLFSSSNLWTNIMPNKIFGDLVSFVGQHATFSPNVISSINPSLTNSYSQFNTNKMMHQTNSSTSQQALASRKNTMHFSRANAFGGGGGIISAMTSLNHSFDSIQSQQNRGNAGAAAADRAANSSAEIMFNNNEGGSMQRNSRASNNYVPIVPSLPQLRASESIMKKPFSKYESVQASVRQRQKSPTMAAGTAAFGPQHHPAPKVGSNNSRAASLKKLSQINKVNQYRNKNRMLDESQQFSQSDYANGEFNMGKTANGLISFGIGAGANLRHLTLNAANQSSQQLLQQQQQEAYQGHLHHNSDVNSADMNSSIAAKDTYLKMLKNKEKFTKKVVMGSGFGLQKKAKLPVHQPGVRQQAQSILEPSSVRTKQQPGSMQIQMKHGLEQDSPYHISSQKALPVQQQTFADFGQSEWNDQQMFASQIDKRMTNYEDGSNNQQLRISNQISHEQYRNSGNPMIKSNDQSTAYLRGASIGDQSDGRGLQQLMLQQQSMSMNKGVGLSHYKNNVAENSNNNIHIANQTVSSGVASSLIQIQQQQQQESDGVNEDLPKINIQLQTSKNNQ